MLLVLQTGAKLQRVQAEFIALAAQDFQAGLKQLQQQHADCLVALQQASPQMHPPLQSQRSLHAGSLGQHVPVRRCLTL